MTPLFRKLLGLNWPLVLIMFGLLIFGVFSIESAARHVQSATATAQHITPGEYWAGKQKTWVLIGAAVFFVTALTDYRWMRLLAIPMWVGSLGLAIKAHGVYESDVGIGQKFQPNQIAITSGVLMLAWLLQDLPRLGRFIPKVGWLLNEPVVKILIIGGVTGISFLIIMMTGDLGSAIVWIPLAGIALLVSGVPFRYLSFMTLLGVAILPVLYFVVLPLKPRGQERISTFLDMTNGRYVDPTGGAWAAVNCGIAIGTAGWAGAGLNATDTMHAHGYIPQKTAHNDYIFAVIAEEQGFRGSILLITSFGLLLVLCLFIGAYARDPMGRLLVGCTVAVLFAHIFENIGMCVLLMPITGIPLPLISYSGTFIIMTMFLLGLVQSVWVHRGAGRLRDEAVELEPRAGTSVRRPALGEGI